MNVTDDRSHYREKQKCAAICGIILQLVILPKTVFLYSQFACSERGNVMLFRCCVVSEHAGQQEFERGHEDSRLPLIASAEQPGNGCATTRTIEVCVNGVKQVIVIPSAQTSSDINVASSLNSQPPPSSSSLSVPSDVALAAIPDDVKLLAESCIQVTSSVQVKPSVPVTSIAPVTSPIVPSLSRPMDADGLSGLSVASFMNRTSSLPPPPYQPNCMPGFACSRPEVGLPRSVYNSAAPAVTPPQFHMNSGLPTSNIPAAQQHFVPFPASNMLAGQHSPAFPTSDMLAQQSLPFPTSSMLVEQLSQPFTTSDMLAQHSLSFPTSGMLAGEHSSAFPTSSMLAQHSEPFPPSNILAAPAFPPVVVLPRGRCAPSEQQPVCTMPLPSPVPPLYPSPAYRGSAMPSQMQPDLMGHLLPGQGSEAPWTSYSTLPMRPTASAYSRTVDTVVNNCFPLGPRFTASQTVPHLPYYMARNNAPFLPSLRNALDDSASTYHPPSSLFHHFRYIPPRNYGHNSHHFDASMYRKFPFTEIAAGRGMAGHQRPAATVPVCATPVTASETRMTNAQPTSLSSASTVASQRSYLSRKRFGRKSSTFRQFIEQTHAEHIVQPMLQQSVPPVSRSDVSYSSLNSYTAGSVACSTTAHSFTMMSGNPAQRSGNDLLHCHPVTASATDVAVSVNLMQATAAVTAVATMPLTSAATSVMQAPYQSAFARNNSNILTDLPVNADQVEVMTAAAVIAAMTETSCQPTATTASTQQLSSAATESDSTTEHLALDLTLQTNVSRLSSATSLANSCSLTSNPSLSNLSVTDLFQPDRNEQTSVTSSCSLASNQSLSKLSVLSNFAATDLFKPNQKEHTSIPSTETSVPSSYSSASNPQLLELLSTDTFAPNSDHSVVSSARTLDRDQPSDVVAEVETSHLGHNSNDLASLPVDVMVETSESESLLMSFCNMFEQSNTAAQDHQPQQSAAAIPSTVTSSTAASFATNSVEARISSASIEMAQRGLQFAKSLGKGRHFAAEMRERHQGRKRRRTQLTSLEYADDDSNSSDSWHPEDTQSTESSDYQSVSSPSATTTSSTTESTVSPVSDESVGVSEESGESQVVGRQRRSKRRRVTRANQRQSSRHSHHHHRCYCSSWPHRHDRDCYCAARPHRHRRDNYSSAHCEQELPVDKSPSLQSALTRRCSVLLERLQLHGRYSINVHHLPSFICCLAPGQRRYFVKPIRRLASTDSESSSESYRSIKKLRVKFLRVEDTESS